jgi:hypothetical protein
VRAVPTLCLIMSPASEPLSIERRLTRLREQPS